MLPLDQEYHVTRSYLDFAKCERLVSDNECVDLKRHLWVDYLVSRFTGPALIYTSLFSFSGPITGLVVSLGLMSNQDNPLLRFGAYQVVSLFPGPLALFLAKRLFGSEIDRLVPSSLPAASSIRSQISTAWEQPQKPLPPYPPQTHLYSLPFPH